MGQQSIQEARRELQAAQAVVDRLRREAEEAKAEQSRLETARDEQSRKLEADPFSPPTSKPTPSDPSYGDAMYWDDQYSAPNSRYDTDDTGSYEWYWNVFSRVSGLISSLLSRVPANPDGGGRKVLDVGCGNSRLLHDMLSVGMISSGRGVDVSPAVVGRMSAEAGGSNLSFLAHDMTAPLPGGFAPLGSLDAAVDKGTMDAILSGE